MIDPNAITIDYNEIALLPDNSITDDETIRQIALYSFKNDKEKSWILFKKVKKGHEFKGLYPHVQKFEDVKPIGMSEDHFAIYKEMIERIIKKRNENK